MLYIYYFLCLEKNWDNLKTLINFDNKINIIILFYAKKLGFEIWKININI